MKKLKLPSSRFCLIIIKMYIVYTLVFSSSSSIYYKNDYIYQDKKIYIVYIVYISI